MAGSSQFAHDNRVKKKIWNGTTYFVPYGKNGNELNWSKAVFSSSRKLAKTEEDCIMLYNKLVED